MYEFLEPYIERSSPGREVSGKKAIVFPVSELEISSFISRLDRPLSDQLLNLYKEIGYGFFNRTELHETACLNRLCHPKDIAQIFDGTFEGLLYDFQLEPNTLPFFEPDAGSFLCLKPKSDNPNAVWHMWGELMPNGGKISDSLVEFFQRLVEDPNWFNMCNVHPS